jgi:hypothetical protein
MSRAATVARRRAVNETQYQEKSVDGVALHASYF